MYLFLTGHSSFRRYVQNARPYSKHLGHRTVQDRDPCLLEFMCWWEKTDNTAKT